MRNDIHRPGVLVPSEYRYRLDFAGAKYPMPRINVDLALQLYVTEGKGAQIHGGIFQCDICGAHYNYGCLFEHVPTGELISVGHDCADKLDLLRDAGAGEMVRRESLRQLERRQNYSKLSAWGRNNRALLPLLSTDHPIARDMRAKLIQTHARWGLTDSQKALLEKLAVRAAQPPEVHVPAPITDGRQMIEGEVVSCKSYDSMYGTSQKITIKVATPAGSWLAWGTLPSNIENNPRGQRIRLQAKLKAGREPHFALFSRPTKAEVIA